MGFAIFALQSFTISFPIQQRRSLFSKHFPQAFYPRIFFLEICTSSVPIFAFFKFIKGRIDKDRSVAIPAGSPIEATTFMLQFYRFCV